MTSTIQALKTVLADTYSLYLKTQNYHWNVTGANFQSLHTMFEVQYNDLAIAIDDIAERIRALGSKAPGTWKAYEELTNIVDGDENKPANDMVSEIADDQKKVIASLQAALAEAQKDGDEVSVGLLVDRMTIHEKTAWMLSSSI